MPRRRLGRLALLVVAGIGIGAFLSVFDVAARYPALEPAVEVYWTGLFWALILVVLGVLVWMIFPTP
jgi:hypothetical protein